VLFVVSTPFFEAEQKTTTSKTRKKDLLVGVWQHSNITDSTFKMTTICVDFPDGSLVSFDRIRREFFITLNNGSLMSVGRIPVRPNPPTVFQFEGQKVVVEEAKAVPITKTVQVKKLGYKKAPVIKTAIWNDRFLRLEATCITYHANESSAAKGTIELRPGSSTRVIQAHEAGRKDRFEDMDNQVRQLLHRLSFCSSHQLTYFLVFLFRVSSL
jgi:hypothetical protein